MTYPAYAAGEYSYCNVYTDLFKKLPPTAKFIILTHPSVADDLNAALKQAKAASRATVITAPEYLQFLVWAEDPYVVVEDIGSKPRSTLFIEPFTFRRASDAVISDLVAEATSLKNTQSPLYFQGGNVLIGDDFVLIGVDYPSNTLRLVEQSGHIRIPDGVFERTDRAEVDTVHDEWPFRRTGRLGIGEIISLVAVSSPSSEDAFAACKAGIGQLKKMRKIIKNEVCG